MAPEPVTLSFPKGGEDDNQILGYDTALGWAPAFVIVDPETGDPDE